MSKMTLSMPFFFSGGHIHPTNATMANTTTTTVAFSLLSSERILLTVAVCFYTTMVALIHTEITEQLTG